MVWSRSGQGEGMNNLFKALVAASFCFVGTASLAATLNFDSTSTSSNSPPTGASATADFTFTDSGLGVVDVSILITNTTGTIASFGAGATTSKLTGIGFDLPEFTFLSIVAGSFTTTGFLDTLSPPGDTDLPPFGGFDVAVKDNSNFQGGNANGALPENNSTTVSFDLNISGSSLANAAALNAAFLSGLADGSLGAVARFQQVNAGAGSDKLLFNPPPPAPVPLPAGAVLLLSAVGGMAFLRRNRA